MKFIMRSKREKTDNKSFINQVFKRMALNINILLAFLLILSNLASIISPLDISVLVLFGLLFPYFLWFNFAFLIFWGLLRNKNLFISLVIIILSLPIINDTYRFFPKHDKTSAHNKFRVLSYNVRVFDLYNWSHNKATQDKIFQQVRTIHPDIACFQEYFTSSGSDFHIHDSLIQNQNFHYSHLYLNVKLKSGNNFGIATYSSFPIVNKELIPFNDSKNLAILSDIKIDDDTLRVINCHLESVRFLAQDYQLIDSISVLSDQKHRKQFNGLRGRILKAAKQRAQQARIIYNEIEKSPYPVMVCGDFNDTPSSYTYHRIASIMNDSFLFHKFGMGGTYTRFFPPLRIDYILYQNRIACHTFKTIRSNYSDHFPITGEYSLR